MGRGSSPSKSPALSHQLFIKPFKAELQSCSRGTRNPPPLQACALGDGREKARRRTPLVVTSNSEVQPGHLQLILDNGLSPAWPAFLPIKPNQLSNYYTPPDRYTNSGTRPCKTELPAVPYTNSSQPTLSIDDRVTALPSLSFLYAI